MDIDNRIVLGVAIVALLLSVYVYKELLDHKTASCIDAPEPEAGVIEDELETIKEEKED